MKSVNQFSRLLCGRKVVMTHGCLRIHLWHPRGSVYGTLLHLFNCLIICTYMGRIGIGTMYCVSCNSVKILLSPFMEINPSE